MLSDFLQLVLRAKEGLESFLECRETFYREVEDLVEVARIFIRNLRELTMEMIEACLLYTSDAADE